MQCTGHTEWQIMRFWGWDETNIFRLHSFLRDMMVWMATVFHRMYVLMLACKAFASGF